MAIETKIPKNITVPYNIFVAPSVERIKPF
mgnify:CR=1 FL=1